MKTVFDSIVSSVGTSQSQAQTKHLQMFCKIPGSRMSISSQIIISDSTRLAQLLRNEVDR